MRGSQMRGLKFTCILAATILLLSTGPVYAVTTHDLESAKKKLEETNAKIREKDANKDHLNREIKAADDQLGALENQLSQLNDQVGKTREEKNKITTELMRLQTELAKTQSKLNKAKTRLKKQTASMNERAGSAYKNGDVSFLEVLLEARDFSDFISRFSFLQTLVDADAKLIRDIKATKAKIEAARETIDKDRASAQLRENELAAEVRQLEELANAKLAKNAEIKTSIKSKEQLIAKIDGERDSLLVEQAQQDAAAKRILAELSKQAGASPVAGNPSAGGYIWPVAGTITGSFGEQRPGHVHSGIDIAVAAGTPVVATKAGIVKISAWYGGYGNLVVIDHGGGITSWYGHNSELSVSVGQQVSRGSVIAKAGSTGHSTGPHVHFEIRVGDAAQNPLNYLP